MRTMAYLAVNDILAYLVPIKTSPQVSDALDKYTQGSYIKSSLYGKENEIRTTPPLG